MKAFFQRLLQTRTRIDGGKFLVVLLMLFGGPVTLALMPLLILTAPMKLMWLKPHRRWWWRGGSIGWLVVSLGIGVFCAWSTDRLVGETLLLSWPLVIEKSATVDSWMFVDPAFADVREVTIRTFNLTIVTGLLMLPWTMASLWETRRRKR